MTNVIQVCSTVHYGPAFIINTRPDDIEALTNAARVQAVGRIARCELPLG
jgi:hypothetical protein